MSFEAGTQKKLRVRRRHIYQNVKKGAQIGPRKPWAQNQGRESGAKKSRFESRAERVEQRKLGTKAGQRKQGRESGAKKSRFESRAERVEQRKLGTKAGQRKQNKETGWARKQGRESRTKKLGTKAGQRKQSKET